jgi:hypothetical protein
VRVELELSVELGVWIALTNLCLNDYSVNTTRSPFIAFDTTSPSYIQLVDDAKSLVELLKPYLHTKHSFWTACQRRASVLAADQRLQFEHSRLLEEGFECSERFTLSIFKNAKYPSNEHKVLTKTDKRN